MKRLLLYIFLSIAPYVYADQAPFSIVFVHIGDQLPTYLETAINQAVLFNKEASIFLVANERALSSLPHYPFLKTVAIESLEKSEEHMRFLERSPLDAVSKKGFWKVTSERFFVLDELMQTYKLTHVFHLENDNMLYVDLGKLLALFKKHYKGIGATFLNDNKCISGFIYFATPAIMHKMAEFMADQAALGLNDMQIFVQFKEREGKEAIDYLPIVPNRYIDLFVLRSKVGDIAKKPERFHNHFADFQSVFDAAALGQYFGGTDPYIGPSWPYYVNTESIFDPRYFDYEWKIDQEGRAVPYATLGDQTFRINSLHIHSKKLQQFVSK